MRLRRRTGSSLIRDTIGMLRERNMVGMAHPQPRKNFIKTKFREDDWITAISSQTRAEESREWLRTLDAGGTRIYRLRSGLLRV